MGQYYYTAAALPMLTFSGEQPVTYDAFLSFCRDTLGSRDFTVLEQLSFSSPDRPIANPLAERWRVWETGLRDALADLRSRALGWGGVVRANRMPSIETARIAQNAAGTGSPLAAEELLDRARWNYLDDLQFGHYFDIEYLIVYSLRLQIVERRRLYTADKGAEAYREIYQSIQASMNAGVRDGE